MKAELVESKRRSIDLAPWSRASRADVKLGLTAVVTKIRKPPALRPGDTVAVVAPAASIERSQLERGVAALQALDYRVSVSPDALARSGILAGSDLTRARALAAAIKDPAVRAVFAARGGYGCGRLLPLLDFTELARTPKIFLGFSDATFILNALVDHARCVSFHGPMVAMDLARTNNPQRLDHLRRLLGGELARFELEASTTLRPGVAEGPLIGGCLSVVAAMMATPWQPRFDHRILFLEDTGEKAYRIDRMLVQLRQAGALERVAGIVFGGLRPVDNSEAERALITECLATQTAGLNCPVLCGIEAGHATENLALPFGVMARLDGRRRRMMVTEAAVS